MKKECQQCHEIFNARRSKMKYCSKSCFGLASRGKNNSNWRGTKITQKCEYCEEKFQFYKTHKRGRFCSYKCYLKFVKKTSSEKKRLKEIYWKKYWNNPTNKTRKAKLAQKRKSEIKLKVLTKYGGNPPKCKCCGEKMVEFLTIDHINGGGNRHRRKMGNRLYKWILKSPKNTKRFQVLCFNCNITKGIYKICPHQKKKLS